MERVQLCSSAQAAARAPRSGSETEPRVWNGPGQPGRAGHLPGVLVDAVDGGRARGAAVGRGVQAAVGGLGQPERRRPQRLGQRGRRGQPERGSLVREGAALAGGALQVTHA